MEFEIHQDIAGRVAKENLWSMEYTLRVIEEYKKFLRLGRYGMVAPSYEIDQIWHAHMLYSKDYRKVCEQVVGFFLHHNPVSKLPNVDNTKVIKSSPNRIKENMQTSKDDYANTKALYMRMFSLVPPKDIWTDWKPTNYAYIDLNTHWVVPAGDWRALVKILFKFLKQ